MKNKLIAGLTVAIFAATIFTGSAEAASTHHAHLAKHHVKLKKHSQARRSTASAATQGQVIALIKNMAPRYGVPTWFALRIAKIESGYNPSIRGSAGEYGVFQMKCATAKGIGFRGNCAQLLNASTNVQFGLKHLSLAVRMSHGNLKLAASKHNGGLGTNHIVRRYVAMVF